MTSARWIVLILFVAACDPKSPTPTPPVRTEPTTWEITAKISQITPPPASQKPPSNTLVLDAGNRGRFIGVADKIGWSIDIPERFDRVLKNRPFVPQYVDLSIYKDSRGHPNLLLFIPDILYHDQGSFSFDVDDQGKVHVTYIYIHPQRDLTEIRYRVGDPKTGEWGPERTFFSDEGPNPGMTQIMTLVRGEVVWCLLSLGGPGIDVTLYRLKNGGVVSSSVIARNVYRFSLQPMGRDGAALFYEPWNPPAASYARVVNSFAMFIGTGGISAASRLDPSFRIDESTFTPTPEGWTIVDGHEGTAKAYQLQLKVTQLAPKRDP
jgi:hypothetical protein